MSLVNIGLILIVGIVLVVNAFMYGNLVSPLNIYATFFFVGVTILMNSMFFEKELKAIGIGGVNVEVKNPEVPKPLPDKIETPLDEQFKRMQLIANYIVGKIKSGIDLPAIINALKTSGYEEGLINSTLIKMKQEGILAEKPKEEPVQEEAIVEEKLIETDDEDVPPEPPPVKTKNKRIPCTECPKTFANKELMKKHFVKEHFDKINID